MRRLILPFLAAGAVLVLGTGPLTGCDPGDPDNRYADFDATLPPSDGAGTNSNNSIWGWLEDCGVNIYPCPPYGTGRNDVLANFTLIPGNEAAEDWANEDGVWSLRDYHQSGQKLLFVFMTAGW